MRRRSVALLVVLAAMGCSGGDGSGSSPASLRPAGDARASAEKAGYLAASLGQAAEFFGLRVTVSTMELGGDSGGPWLAVTVRAENAGDRPLNNPDVKIVCTGNEEAGGWQAGSTFKLGEDLPPQSFDEGVVHLLLPDDGRFGQPVPACKTPAVVRASATGFTVSTGGPEGAEWSISDALVAQLNAARRQ